MISPASVNQWGEPVFTRVLESHEFERDPELVARVLHLLLTQLELQAVVTNATQYGFHETQLRSTK